MPPSGDHDGRKTRHEERGMEGGEMNDTRPYNIDANTGNRKENERDSGKKMIACMQINGGGRVRRTRETVAIIMIYGTLSSSGCTDAPKHRSLRANNGLGLFS